MFAKLDGLYDRYRELSEAIAQPEIIQDYPRYQAILKERSALEPLVEKYETFLQVEKHIAEAKELTTDPDLAVEAEAELNQLSEKRLQLIDELPPIPISERSPRADIILAQIREEEAR